MDTAGPWVSSKRLEGSLDVRTCSSHECVHRERERQETVSPGVLHCPDLDPAFWSCPSWLQPYGFWVLEEEKKCLLPTHGKNESDILVTTSTENSDYDYVFVVFVAAWPGDVTPAAPWWISEGTLDWISRLMPGPDRHDEALTHYRTACFKASKTGKRSWLVYRDDNRTEIIRLSFMHSRRSSLGQDTSCFLSLWVNFASLSFTLLANAKKTKLQTPGSLAHIRAFIFLSLHSCRFLSARKHGGNQSLAGVVNLFIPLLLPASGTKLLPVQQIPPFFWSFNRRMKSCLRAALHSHTLAT